MRVTGIIRRVDDLGRIVIPKCLREKLDIANSDAMEIFIDEKEKTITFKKYLLTTE